MKNTVKIVTAVFFAVYVLAISCGFTISHVCCPEGEQWVMGAEMPPCKYSSEAETSCCKSEGPCSNVSEKNNDKRKKHTYDFKFDLEGKEVSSQDTGFIIYDFQFSYIPLSNVVDLFPDISVEKNFFGFHPPPDLLKPDLTELQVFLI